MRNLNLHQLLSNISLLTKYDVHIDFSAIFDRRRFILLHHAQTMWMFTATDNHLIRRQAIELIHKKDVNRLCSGDLDNLRDIYTS